MAETLQSFLIDIGYRVDEPAERKTQGGLKNTTYLALELGKAAVNAAQDFVNAMQRMAQAVDDLYFASLRTNSTVEGIKAMSFAASQLGSSGGAALSALEGVAKLMATNPGGESFLNSMGVVTRDANNQLLQTTQIMSNLGRAMRNMPLPTANYIGNFLGIDYKQILAMRQGLEEYEAQYRQMSVAARINTVQAAKDSNFLMTEIRTLGAAFDILGDKVTANLARRGGETIRSFRRFVVDHFDQIAGTIERVIEGVSFFLEALAQIGTRGVNALRDVVTWFKDLDVETKRMILTVGGLTAAWYLLSTAFAASPVGRVIALGTAIMLLYDDYKTWKENGTSLIDWAKWEPAIRQAVTGIEGLKKPLLELFTAIERDLIPSLGGLQRNFSEISGSIFGDTLEANIKKITDALKEVVTYLTHVVTLYAAIARGDWPAAMAAASAIAAQIIPSSETMRQNREENARLRLESMSPEEREGWDRYGRAMNGAPGSDNRNWWERVMPSILGGKPPPASPTGAQAPGAYDPNQVHPQANVNVDRQAAALEAYDHFRRLDYSHAGAIGMTTNMMAESRGDPAARGDGGRAHGVFQHHPDRRADILARTTAMGDPIDISTASAERQRYAAHLELVNGWDRRGGRSAEAIRTASDPRVAASLVSTEFIRPGREESDRIAERNSRAAASVAWDRLITAQRPQGSPPAPALAGPAIPAPVVVQMPPAPALRPVAALPAQPPPAPTPANDPGQAFATDLRRGDRLLRPETAAGVPPAAGRGDTALNQETNITINNPTGNGEEIGEAVRRAQDRSNEAAVRNLRGAVR